MKKIYYHRNTNNIESTVRLCLGIFVVALLLFLNVNLFVTPEDTHFLPQEALAFDGGVGGGNDSSSGSGTGGNDTSSGGVAGNTGDNVDNSSGFSGDNEGNSSGFESGIGGGNDAPSAADSNSGATTDDASSNSNSGGFESGIGGGNDAPSGGFESGIGGGNDAPSGGFESGIGGGNDAPDTSVDNGGENLAPNVPENSVGDNPPPAEDSNVPGETPGETPGASETPVEDSGDGSGGGTSPESPPVQRGGPGGIGGPGGLNAPLVSLSSVPAAGEQPLAFVTLSQIPYTGFKAGTLTAAIYFTLLLIWSAFIAYLILTRTYVTRFVHAFKTSFAPVSRKAEEKHIVSDSDIYGIQTGGRESGEEELTTFPDLAPESQGFAAVDTIVLEAGSHGQSPRLEIRRTPRVGEGAKKEAVHNFPNEARVHTSSLPVSGVKPENVCIPNKGILISQAIRSVVLGEISPLLEIIQSYKSKGENILELLVQMLCELDRLLCRRSGELEVLNDETIEDIFENWHNKDIERLIHILSTGVDQNYLTQHTSAKMALLRALEFSKQTRRI